jgi:RNA polymerase sigma-70 factor, ECF subfamily
MSSRAPETDPLVALQGGDPLPFEAFVRSWSSTLVAYFIHQGSPASRAEDLTQDVFLRLYKSAMRYRPRERFTAYCFRTARNVWIDDCRRSAARGERLGESSDPAETPGHHPDPSAPLVFREEERSLQALLDELPIGQRRVFELVLLAELDYGEIGAMLSIPVGTVKSRMFHAVRKLRLAWARRAQEGVARA